MKNVFNIDDLEFFNSRINSLKSDSQAVWGKMNVAQMLAHCNVPYEQVYENKHSKPSAFKSFILKMFVKNIVVSEKPYKKNGPTAPEFKIVDAKDFETEKTRLLQYLSQTQRLGESYFNGKASHSFGNLSTQEWNALFSKHLDHHLSQFGV